MQFAARLLREHGSLTRACFRATSHEAVLGLDRWQPPPLMIPRDLVGARLGPNALLGNRGNPDGLVSPTIHCSFLGALFHGSQYFKEQVLTSRGLLFTLRAYFRFLVFIPQPQTELCWKLRWRFIQCCKQGGRCCLEDCEKSAFGRHGLC